MKPTDTCDFLEDDRKRRYLPVQRLQLPVSSAAVLTAYGLQGATVPGIFVDLKRPPGMQRDEHWMSVFVLLFRAQELRHMLIYRMCKREDLEGGPPEMIQIEKERLRQVERATARRLDEQLKHLLEELSRLASSYRPNSHLFAAMTPSGFPTMRQPL